MCCLVLVEDEVLVDNIIVNLFLFFSFFFPLHSEMGEYMVKMR